jgi:NTE family protein
MLPAVTWHWLVLAVAAWLLVGCASRPVNPPLEAAVRTYGYRTEGRDIRGLAGDTMVVLAFSGGGTRAAAFSYGVL